MKHLNDGSALQKKKKKHQNKKDESIKEGVNCTWTLRVTKFAKIPNFFASDYD